MAGTGFRLSLAGAKSKPGAKPAAGGARGGLNPPPSKRPRLSALGDDEPEDDEGKGQEIAGWDATAGGAVELSGRTKQQEEQEKNKPRIIAAQPNRNWREDAVRKAKGANRPAEKGTGNAEGVEKPQLPNGLNLFPKKDAAAEAASSESKPAQSGDPMAVDSSTNTNEDTKPADDEARLENAALTAILTGKEAVSHDVIPLTRSERDAFEQDYESARAVPTVAAYEATPIDGFGAALLRGMGWKDGEETGPNRGIAGRKKAQPPKEVKPRPPLLAIGAKPEAAIGLDPDSAAAQAAVNSKAAFFKAKEQLYKPVAVGVARRNKKTGEIISEEEFQKRLEQQSVVGDGAGAGAGAGSGSDNRSLQKTNGGDTSRRKGKYDDDSEEEYRRSKRRDRERRDGDRGSDRDRDREKPRRKEIEYSSKHDDRDRQSYSHSYRDRDGGDRDRNRDRDRERDRDKGKDRDRERDRDRDRHHRRDKESYRERDRDRDRHRDGDRRSRHHHRSRSRSPERKRRRDD